MKEYLNELENRLKNTTDLKELVGIAKQSNGLANYLNAIGQPTKRKTDGFVYFITDFKKVKIGWAINPTERMKTLQIGNPRQLFLIWKYKGTLKDEGKIHKKFKKYRFNGEWFNANNEIMNFIKNKCDE